MPKTTDQALSGRRRASRAEGRRPHRGGVTRTLAGLGGSLGPRSPLRRRLQRLAEMSVAAPWLAALALGVFFALFSTDLLVLLHRSDALASLVFTGDGGGADDARRDEVEATKAFLARYVYLLVVGLAVVHRRRLRGFVEENLHMVAIVGVVLLGMLWSVEPTKVLTNAIQLVVGMLAAALFALTRTRSRSPYLSLCVTVLVPMLALHLTSVWVFFEAGLELEPFLNGLRRYGGIAGNPNALGGQCVIGVFAALAVLIDRDSRRALRVLGALGLATFAFCIVVSGSGTALVSALLVVAVMVPLRFLSRVGERFRMPVVLGMVFLIVVVGGAYALQNDANDFVAQLTGSLGKEENFTGRTELWATARAAIAEHPIRGWSLDAHATVKEERSFFITYGHYHNGFLDLLVAGGAVLGALVAFNFWRFGRSYLRLFTADPRCYALVLPLAVLFMLNMTEYSLLRPLNVIYQLYLCAWAVLHVESHALEGTPVTPERPSRRRRRSSASKAFSF